MSAVPALSEVPSLRDEIDRKAFEQLERLAGQLETGRINAAQFDCGVQTVWNCVSGLASEFIIQTISEIKDSRKEVSHLDRRFFVSFIAGKWETLILTRGLAGSNLTLRSIPPGRKTNWDFAECANPPFEALKKQNHVAEMLVGKGFRQI